MYNTNLKNILFSEATACDVVFGFCLDRINDSNHIYIHTNVSKLIQLQNVTGKVLLRAGESIIWFFLFYFKDDKYNKGS